MAILYSPIQQRAFFFGNSTAKLKIVTSTLQDLHLPTQIRCSSKRDDDFKSVESLSQFKEIRNVACGILAVWAVTAVSPVIAANQNVYLILKLFLGFLLGGYRLCRPTRIGTDFSNAVVDRVNFGKANLQGAVFKNTVLSGSTFDDAQLQDVDFEDTIIGYIDLQKLCVNKTINEEGRANLGCR
ncbi:hypothetical protein DH2020_048536 [Rehmannia glutinosa]|uniref:Uncharacterized protein n=1 Tax=Rehmannia glutinosa TaxID=99300 RepID=A0ABR0U5B5_REHGL